jgi:hypothetical protein
MRHLSIPCSRPRVRLLSAGLESTELGPLGEVAVDNVDDGIDLLAREHINAAEHLAPHRGYLLVSVTICSATQLRELAKQELGRIPTSLDRLLSTALRRLPRERVIARSSSFVAPRKAFCLPLVIASSPMRLHLR